MNRNNQIGDMITEYREKIEKLEKKKVFLLGCIKTLQEVKNYEF